MTDERRQEDSTSEVIGENRGLDNYEVVGIKHEHEIESEHPDGVTHSHLPNLLAVCNW